MAGGSEGIAAWRIFSRGVPIEQLHPYNRIHSAFLTISARSAFASRVVRLLNGLRARHVRSVDAEADESGERIVDPS